MNVTYDAAARFLRERDGFLILTHKRPDGDAIGCAVALCLALRKLGKTAYLLENEDATALFTPYCEGLLSPPDFAPDTVVAVDLASLGLFPQSALPYRDRVDLVIDHHPSNEGYGQYNCVEADKAACGEIIFKVIEEWFPVDAAMALPLYLAVSTDTGCFQYSNTTANTHRVAAALMDTGVDVFPVNKLHFRTKSYARLRLEGRIMETLELHDGGAIALASVTLADQEEIHTTQEDLDNISAFIGQLAGVQTAVTIQELHPGECKLSVRTGVELNASKVCALLGGGGHAAASGCTVMGTVAEAKAAIMGAIRTIQRETEL
jgi:phosphoesterase RecJ-like protein